MKYLIGDIGNTSTKICILSRKFQILRSYNFETIRMLKGNLIKTIIRKKINKGLNPIFLFSSVVPKVFLNIKKGLKFSKYKVLELKKFFKDKNIKIRNFSIKDQSIFFDVNVMKKEEVLSLLDDDKSEINTYFQQFKSHEFDIENEDNSFKLTYSDYGLVLLKNSSLDQAIETVRRRVDEVGTNEPNILKRGNDRILVELPGLDDPGRIKSLLGKTANLTFQFVATNRPAFRFDLISLSYLPDLRFDQVLYLPNLLQEYAHLRF